MERPEHNLRGQMGGTSAQLAPRRFSGLILVTAIHIGIIALLVLGMVANDIEKKKEDRWEKAELIYDALREFQKQKA